MNRRQFLTVAGGLFLAPALRAHQRFEAQELAAYRLTEEVFQRFAHATRVIAKVIRSDERFVAAPLITREILRDGDAADMAATLHHRLEDDAALAAALFAADITARDYAAFAIALFAARLAHGFVKSGAMRRVPPGVATDNVAFIARHETDVAALLQQLNLE